ncbi:AIR synthase-related protein [Micromonospora sp. DT41]|uniref:AIR synthase-related protein n=1 Tax=Micromonospora sp. DT41 TaxID=3393437 RepID=UPI003CE9F43E
MDSVEDSLRPTWYAALAGVFSLLTAPAHELLVGLEIGDDVTGYVFPAAVATMTTLNRDASPSDLTVGVIWATDVTDFGLLGHLHKLARASGVTAVVDAAATPCPDGAREAARDGSVSGGSCCDLDWVRPHTRWGADVIDLERLLLAEAQTSGGLLDAGKIPGAKVIGELVPADGNHTLVAG